MYQLRPSLFIRGEKKPKPIWKCYLGGFPTFYWLEMYHILLLVATETFMTEEAREDMTKVIFSEPVATG